MSDNLRLSHARQFYAQSVPLLAHELDGVKLFVRCFHNHQIPVVNGFPIAGSRS
jgi:hypothetical protein